MINLFPPLPAQLQSGLPGKPTLQTNDPGKGATPDFATALLQPVGPIDQLQGAPADQPPVNQGNRTPWEMCSTQEMPHQLDLPAALAVGSPASQTYPSSIGVEHVPGSPAAPVDVADVASGLLSADLDPSTVVAIDVPEHAPRQGVIDALPSAGIAAAVTPAMRADVSGTRMPAVELPWRLQANAGMSYRLQGAIVIGQLQRNHDVATELLNRAPGSGGGARFAANNGDRRGQAVAMEPETYFSRAADAVAADKARDPAASKLAQAGWAPLLMWPQRLLRWLNDAEGVTAWVRDFQMDPAQVSSLLESLHCAAETQGIPLRRIMLNGHEAWRSTMTQGQPTWQ